MSALAFELLHPVLGQPVQVYEYERLSGDLAFVNCRFDPKDFRVAHKTANGRWAWNLNGTPPLLYRLRDVEAALAAGETIWIVDGEKDADALAEHGVAATCCARAQGGWSVELAEQLAGIRAARIVADNDDGVGLTQAQEVRDLLLEVTGIGSHEIEIVRAAEGKDAYDHLAAGHGLDQFVPVIDTETVERSSWQPLNLNLLPDKPPVQPTLGGSHLLYPGKRHVFSGPPESAKTLAAYALLILVVRAGATAILIDFEMGSYEARDRLRELGASTEEIGRVHYLEPDEPATSDRIDALVRLQPALVVLDAAAGAYSLQGLDDNKRGDVETLSNLYVRAFWRAGIASVLLDHVVKNVEQRGRFQIGSERKLGGADVHLGFEPIKAISRGGSGLYKIVTHKDRGGYLRRGHLADLKLESDEQHNIAWSFLAASESGGYFRPTGKMEFISKTLSHMPSTTLTRNDVVAAVGGKKTVTLAAINALVWEGYLGEVEAPGKSKPVRFLRPFTEADDPFQADEQAHGSLVLCGSQVVPGTTLGTGSHGSRTYGTGTQNQPSQGPPEEGGWFPSLEPLPADPDSDIPF